MRHAGRPTASHAGGADPRPSRRDLRRRWRASTHGSPRTSRSIGLPSTRPLDAGFAAITWRWASGQDLDDALAGTDLTPGDFVRATKQVADVLGQIADTRRGAAAGRAHDARRAIVRGVVAYAGL